MTSKNIKNTVFSWNFYR